MELLPQPGSSSRKVPETPAPSKSLPQQEQARGCELFSSLNTRKSRMGSKTSWLLPGFDISTKAGSCGERLKVPFPPVKHCLAAHDVEMWGLG